MFATVGLHYFDVLNNQINDREPSNTDWDVVFTNYVLELAPGYFGGVTSVLHNNGVTVSEISGVPVANATYNVWDTTVATIGYNWKAFDMVAFQYNIIDSLCYFVQTANGDVWKLIFTDFEGGSTGNIHFTKEQVEFAGIPVHEGVNMEVYPNPANQSIHVNYAHGIASITLMNMNGQTVLEQTSQLSTIDVSSLKEGFYFLKVVGVSNGTATQKIIVQH